MLENLPKSELQELIGFDNIERIETVMTALMGADFDPISFNKKDTIADAARAFAGARLFSDRRTVETLLRSLPPKQRDAITGACNVDRTKDVSEMARELVSVRDSQRKIAELLRVSFVEGACEGNVSFSWRETISTSKQPFKQLKAYQMKLYLSALELIKPNLQRCVLQMPTGTGKTRTAMEIVATTLNECREDDVVVWLAHSVELCEQARACFQDVWSHLGGQDIELFMLSGKTSGIPFDIGGKHFLVGSFQKIYSLVKKERVAFDSYKKRVKLVVVDEAHKVVAPTYKAATEAFLGNATRVLGLTATPGRSIVDSDENKALSSFFFGRLLELESPTRQDLFSYLRAEQLMAQAFRIPLESGREYILNKGQISALEKFSDLPSGFLKEIGSDDARNAVILSSVLKEAEAGEQVLLFACSVEQSRFLAATLRMRGVSALHLDGKSPSPYRASVIQAFKSKKVQVLCNYGVLTTGFDAPSISSLIITRPTSSIVLYSQMIGRGLRGPRLGGTKVCRIIEVIDNIVGMPTDMRAFEFFDAYWDK